MHLDGITFPLVVARLRFFGPVLIGVLIVSVAGGRMSIMTTRRRKSPDQIVRLLSQADQLLANGEDLASVCCALGISVSSFHRWRI